jgi:NTP pyrophosphatase (non-canonical NTP hydrolase)
MSRAQEFMDQIWKKSENGSDTEEKLVSSILSLAGEYIKSYNAQNGITVLDKNDLIQLSQEIGNLK